MTLVKICGITKLEDALRACDAGADALGFNFWPASPRYIAPPDAARIIGRLPGAVLTVGVFVDTAADEVAAISKTAGIEVAQLHGRADAPPMRWWRAMAASAGIPVMIETSLAEAVLIDAPAGDARGGTGRTFDWRLAAGLPGRVILAGGLGPENVAEAIGVARPWGVDACSRLEIKPGRKDPARVAAFVRAVRESE